RSAMKILFLSTRRAKPSFRFRVEQFLPYFQEKGHACDVAFLTNQPLSRLWLYRRLSAYDAVFLQKRLLSRAELFLVRQRAKRLIYDVDDAVMFNGKGQPELRRQSRFRATVAAADLVICGNSYLADQARNHARRIEVIPTCIDSEMFHPRLKSQNAGPLTIGWTGSRSTNQYLNPILPVIGALGPRVQFRFLSDMSEGVDLASLGNVSHRFTPWSPEVEITETASFDIGLMPLPDNPWTRGKCGFKALQYMGLGIPAVCSPVGVNGEILTHEKNGLLASSPEEWANALTRLVEDSTFREQLGQAGRKRIEEHYAVNVQAPRLIELIEQISLPQKRSA
ncbi:MAG: glycosyltransferase, partial [Planctomycetaceae bacterium]|nr:glycosyltransferase [Planctomycetaceae bacterium]